MLVIALVVVIVFALLGKLISSIQILFAWTKNQFVKDTAKQFVRIFMIVLGFVLALEILNATALVGAILGTAGVVGIAVGFAFKDLIENHLAGILLSLRQPFMPRDFVAINDYSGTVTRLTSRATILLTSEGNHLRIPNSVVFKSVILNYSKNPRRRFDFDVGVGCNENLRHAQDVGIEAVSKIGAVLQDPAPSSQVTLLADSSVTLRFFGWVDQTKNDFGKSRSASINAVKTALDDEGVSMPEPTYRVQMVEAESGERPAETSSKGPAPVDDTTVDSHVDRAVAEERRGQGDLLDENATSE